MAIIDVVNDIVRVTVAWQYPDSQIIMNNVCFRCVTAGGADTRNGLGTACANDFSINYLAQVAPAASLYGYKVANLNRVPNPLPVTAILSTPGTGSNPNCPTQVRPILRFKTANTGRKYRGRLFLPPPQTAGVTTAGFPAAGLQAAIAALGTALIAPNTVGGSTWNPVIAHRVKKAPLATTSDDILAFTSPTLFGTQWKSGNTGRINVTPW